MFRTAIIKLVLRVGLGINCIGFALCSFLYPENIIEFYPQFIPNLIGELTTLIAGALLAIGMTVWLFSRKHKFACSFTFLIILFLAIITNITSISFISVCWPLFIIALALTIRYYPRVRIIIPHKGGERMKIVPIIAEDETTDAPHTTESNGDDEVDDDEEAEIDLHHHKDRKQNKRTIISQLHEDRVNHPSISSIPPASPTAVEASIEEGLTDIVHHEQTHAGAGDFAQSGLDTNLKEEKANHTDPEIANDAGQFIQYNPEIQPVATIVTKKKRVYKPRKKAEPKNDAN